MDTRTHCQQQPQQLRVSNVISQVFGSWHRDLLAFGNLLHPSESNHGGHKRRSRACHFRSRDYVPDKTGFKLRDIHLYQQWRSTIQAQK